MINCTYKISTSRVLFAYKIENNPLIENKDELLSKLRNSNLQELFFILDQYH